MAFLRKTYRGLVLMSGLILAATTATGQDPVAAFPKNYSLALENAVVKVVRVHYGPREKIGVHDHSEWPTVYVYLSDSGPVRFEHFEEERFTLTRPPTVAGTFRVSPGRIERHSVENLGDASSDFLRVELKQVPLGVPELHFRGKAPVSLDKDGTTVEFNAKELVVQRIVCLNARGCEVARSAAPSLLVAFTPALISQPTGGRLAAGAVRWLPASQGCIVAGASASPAHLLRILLPTAGR